MKRGRKALIAWPNMCDSGKVERKRSSPKGRTRCSRFRKARSIGKKSEARLPCVRTTPFGSPVVPEVKTISAVLAGFQAAGRGAAPPCHAPISTRRQPGSARRSRGATAIRTAARAATSARNASPEVSSSGTATAPRVKVASNASIQSGPAGPWMRMGVPSSAPAAASAAAHASNPAAQIGVAPAAPARTFAPEESVAPAEPLQPAQALRKVVTRERQRGRRGRIDQKAIGRGAGGIRKGSTLGGRYRTVVSVSRKPVSVSRGHEAGANLSTPLPGPVRILSSRSGRSRRDSRAPRLATTSACGRRGLALRRAMLGGIIQGESSCVPRGRSLDEAPARLRNPAPSLQPAGRDGHRRSRRRSAPFRRFPARLGMQLVAGPASGTHRLRQLSLPVLLGIRRQSVPDQPGAPAPGGLAAGDAGGAGPARGQRRFQPADPVEGEAPGCRFRALPFSGRSGPPPGAGGVQGARAVLAGRFLPVHGFEGNAGRGALGRMAGGGAATLCRRRWSGRARGWAARWSATRFASSCSSASGTP